jgi:predicted translin family RNA/ssDNA-binding protein
MNDIQSIRDDAVKNAKLAVESDDKGNAEEASKYYIKAAEKLKMLITRDDNQYNKDTYRKKAIEYCERAQILKNTVKQTEDKPSPVLNGSTIGGK